MDVAAMTDQELDDALVQVSAEREKRLELNRIPHQINELNREYLRAAGVAEGAAWVEPSGGHDAYPVGWLVNHGGQVWESITPANSWAPGERGWRVHTRADGTPGNWVKPTQVLEAYAEGAEVTHQNEEWVSKLPDNQQEPGVEGWVPPGRA